MKYLSVLFFGILLSSCTVQLLDENTEEYLAEVTDSKDVKVFQKNKNTIIQLIGSSITDPKEQAEFYTVAAKTVFESVNEHRTSFDTNGSHVVQFLDNSGESSEYSILNSQLIKATKIFNQFEKFINLLLEGNINKLFDLVVESDEKSNLVNALINSINLNERSAVNTYGFYIDKKNLHILVSITNREETGYFKFSFDLNTHLLKKFEIIDKL